MSAIAVWDTQPSEQLAVTAATTDESVEALTSRNGTGVAALQELVLRLLSEVQGINEASPINLETGFDFYDEVSRFEIDLIKRALLQTGGHQVQAARLLNLKVTTLNSKIKHYHINPTGLAGLANVFPLVDSTRQQEQQSA